MQSNYTIKIITDFDTMDDLAAEWNELSPPSSVEPWQSFSWHRSVAKANEKTSFLRLFTVRKNGRLLAIAPMVLRQSEQPLKPWRLGFLGEEELKEPNWFVGSDPGTSGKVVPDSIRL
jgi:CelD/BcsL family acetyltransferase involved in cellulose biosynthesis